MSEQFYWGVVATNAHGKIQELAVCEEGALTEVKADMEQRWVLVRKFPASFHESVTLVTPEMVGIAVEMRDLLWGPPGSVGPGKTPGRQLKLKNRILKLVGMLGGDNGET